MTVRLLVKRTSGTSAKGIPKESTTWLKTSAWVGLTCRASSARAGSMVTARRAISGTRRFTKPAITTCPE